MENTKSSTNGILIVNPPGELQISLQALLTSYLDLDVLVVSEIESALKVIESFNPTMIIVDQNISKKDPISILSKFKSSWPSIPCLILANDEQSLQKFSQWGADHVFLKGMRGTDLIEEIKGLLAL